MKRPHSGIDMPYADSTNVGQARVIVARSATRAIAFGSRTEGKGRELSHINGTIPLIVDDHVNERPKQ